MKDFAKRERRAWVRAQNAEASRLPSHRGPLTGRIPGDWKPKAWRPTWS